MTKSIVLGLTLCALVVPLSAQTQGADVIVGDLYDPQSYGSQGNIAAFAIGTTSCNVGNVPLNWFALPSVDHPVIGQNIYRIKDGEFEQIGMSWLKHGFFALSQNLCSPCNPTPGTTLGVGCSDPYSGGLNGSQSNLGPRSDVNATTGVFTQPNPPGYSGVIARRIQIQHADLDPAQNQGAVYLGEGQYVASDDAAAGNDDNNASWREAVFTGSGSNYNLQLIGSTQREDPAIVGWQSFVPSVQLQTVDVPGDGRFIVGYNSRPLPNGLTRHFFAVHNLNSHRGAKGLVVNVPSAAQVQNPYFRDVDHHSGEPYTNTDWTATITPGGVAFTNDATFSQNPNANALRWGTCYSFAFESDMMPGQLTLELFRPGTPSQVNVPAFGAPPPPPFAVNKPAASMDLDGLNNDPFTGPILANRSPGDLVNLNIGSSLPNAPFSIGLGLAPAVPNGFFFGDEVLNLDLLDPTFNVALEGTTALFGGGLTLPLTMPAGTFGFTAQMVVIDPSASAGLRVSAAVQLFSAPCLANTESLTLGDDNSVTLAVGTGSAHDCIPGVTFAGVSHTSLFVNSNGTLSFGQGTGDFTPSVSEFVGQMPRFGFWADLNPTAGGTITASSTAAGILTVSYSQLPEWGGVGDVSYDYEYDSNTGAWSFLNYAPNGFGGDTLIGLNPGPSGPSNAVNWAGLAGTTQTPGNAAAAVHQLQTGSAPTGFTSILFPMGDASTYTVN